MKTILTITGGSLGVVYF